MSAQTGRYSKRPTGGRPPLPPEVKNGRIPVALLGRCHTQAHLGLPYLYAPAAAAFDAMVDAAARDGVTLQAVALYRDYAGQVREKQAWTKAHHPENAASPGHSNHGWGTAVDINRHLPGVLDWLAENGPRWGWDHPLWAGSEQGPEHGREPWHWQFIIGFKLEDGEMPETESARRIKHVKINGHDQTDRVKAWMVGDGNSASDNTDLMDYFGWPKPTYDAASDTLELTTPAGLRDAPPAQDKGKEKAP